MTATAASTHRVSRAVAGARDQLGAVAQVPLWSMDVAETTAAIEDVLALEAQLAELKARLDTGEKISPSLARRLACEAGIIPAVLDGASQVLDLGRKKRFHNQAQRIAATLNQAGTCIVEGCDATAGLSQMHHPTAWSAGGGTDRDGMLICAPHHTRIHDTRYRYTHAPGGRITFTRRT
jgi:hypothetical protein